MNNDNFPKVLAWATMDLLVQRRALLSPNGVAFYVWHRPERLIVVFDPATIALDKVNADFVHALSTRLHGRLIVKTNSRGMFLQVGLDVPTAPMQLIASQLSLADQPTPWSIPVGNTARGPLWVSLMDGDSFLIGGSRGGGKTGEEHAWIQALLHGNQTAVYAWDGKRGAEFGRYVGHDNFHIIMDAAKGLQQLQRLFTERERLLAQSGYPNISMHNDAGREFIMPIALFVDEAADLADADKETLKKMIRLYRYLGLHPVIATNQPTQAEVMAKTNLSTRIAFRVPHHNDSVTMIGYKGAESLPDVRGRGLIVWKGSIVEFQSFNVDYPMPTTQTLQVLADQVKGQNDDALHVDEARGQADEVIRVLDMHAQGKSEAAIAGEVFGKYSGGPFYTAKKRVREIVAQYGTSSSTSTPDLSSNMGLQGVA